MRQTIIILLTVTLAVIPSWGQQRKMSAFVRQIAKQIAADDQHAATPSRQLLQPMNPVSPTNTPTTSSPNDQTTSSTNDQTTSSPNDQTSDTPDQRMLCTLVRTSDADADQLFSRHEGRSLAHWGDIHIVMLPLRNLRALAAESTVSRIETGPTAMACMDSCAMHVNAQPVYEGTGLPQAYTGQGVIMGIVDIGFDLTHPNFFSADLSEYRISRLWDQLAPDSLGESSMPMGKEIVGREALLEYGCSYDGYIQTHGTHTLGIAAGSGYNSPYRGMAWDTDICLVANATSDDKAIIDSIDYYKYTSATDLLAFKYIFDYAEEQQRPCVISFSEGSPEYLDDDQQLYNIVLDSLTGPGRIMVASAGNNGFKPVYLHKPYGKASAGAYLRAASPQAHIALRSREPFRLRVTAYANLENPDAMTVEPFAAFCDSTKLQPDSITGETVYIDSLIAANGTYVYEMVKYPAYYNPQDTVVEMVITAPRFEFGSLNNRVSIELLGADADVECFVLSDKFMTPSDDHPVHNDSELTHSVFSPGAAPAVICVGSTTLRKSFVNFRGVLKEDKIDYGQIGHWASYSSVGPAVDGRIKPDIAAPGGHTFSSTSSFYYEKNPFGDNTNASVDTFTCNGRKYLWTADLGTSMASPVVGGAIALWLQAKPTLTPEEIKQILADTSVRPDASLDYPNNRYGYGVIDVYRGLLHVLGLSNIREISQQQPRQVKVLPKPGHQLQLLFSATEHPHALTLYNLAGECLWQTALADSTGNSSLIRLPQLPQGVYVVQLHGPSPSSHGSTLIRLE